jgi:hypothetical protein
VWPGHILAASAAGPVVATAAEAAAAVLQRAVETGYLLAPAAAAAAATHSGCSSAAEQAGSDEAAACMAAYQLLSQLTLELGDMLEKTFQHQQRSDRISPELLKSLPASASRLLHSTEVMLQLCSWVLAVEGSQLIQILSCDLPPSVIGSASCPAGSSQPSSFSNHPQAGPCSSPQYAEGLLLHNADLLAALLNGAAGSTVSASAPHTQQLASAALHSLKQAVQQHQALLEAPGSFLTAAGAASAVAVTSTEQHVPGDPTQSSPACFQLLTAVGRLLKGLVQVCLHQYDDFVASGMTYWLIGGSRKPNAAAAAGGDQDSGETAGSSGGSNSGSTGGSSTSSSSGSSAAPDASSSAAASVKPSERLSSLMQLLVCTAGAALTIITVSTRRGCTVAAAEVLQLSGSLIEAAELLLELPVTLQCKAARIIMQLGGDKTAIAASFDKLWARSSQEPGTRKHSQQLLLSVGASAQEAPAGMQSLWHAVCTTLLPVNISNTVASSRRSSSQPSVTAVLGQVCALHRGLGGDVLKMAMEQRRGGGSLLAMLLDSQLRLVMETGSQQQQQQQQQQHLQRLAFAVQVLEAATRTTLHHIWTAEVIGSPAGAQQSTTSSTSSTSGGSSKGSSSRGGRKGSSSRGHAGGRGSASSNAQAILPHGQDLSLAPAGEGCSLFMGLEHSVMRPVARTAAEVFATAAATAATSAGTAATAAATGSTSSSSSSTAPAAASKEGCLLSSSDGQVLLQALLSHSLTVSKACAGLIDWQWYNWPEKPGAETSPLLLANLALLTLQSQLAASEQLHAQTSTEGSAAALVSLQHASGSCGAGGSNSSSDGGGGSSGGGDSGGSGSSSDAATVNTAGVSSSSSGSGSSSIPHRSGYSFPAVPWQQLLCAAAALTSKMLHVEAGSVSQARQGLPTSPAAPSSWLCANLFRIQTAGNTAIDLLQQHAQQLGVPVWEAPTAGTPGSGGPGSLLWQVQLTCTLLQRWCDWISKGSSSEGAQAGYNSTTALSVLVGPAAEAAASTAATGSAGQAAAQNVSQMQQQQQQQQRQQLVKGLQDTVKVLSGQLLPVLSELHKLSEHLVEPKHRCDLDSDDPAQTGNLTNAFRFQFSTEFVRFGPSEEEKRRSKAILAAFSGVAAALQAASSALAAAVPCSYTCNNNHCRNLSTVSEGFALVRGKGCVCGGCLGVGRDCSVAPAGSQSLLAAR